MHQPVLVTSAKHAGEGRELGEGENAALFPDWTTEHLSLDAPSAMTPKPARRTQVGRGQAAGRGRAGGAVLVAAALDPTLNPAERAQVGRGQKLG